MTIKRQQELFGDAPEELPWDRDERHDRPTCSVVFAAAPYGPLDYRVPNALAARIAIGLRVRVPLGRGNRLIEGYCVQVNAGGIPAKDSLKELESLIDESPLLPQKLFELTRWISDYYLCPWGCVIEAVIPAGVRSRAGVRDRIWYKVAHNWEKLCDPSTLTPIQQRVLTTLIEAPQSLTLTDLCRMAACTSGPIKRLQTKGLIFTHKGSVQYVPRARKRIDHHSDFSLNAEQQAALDSIKVALQAGRHETVLVYGVTGSGKTEVYIQAIQEAVAQGRQAIVLVPEISLTAQTRQRFDARFENTAVLHSKLTDSERHWHWRRIARGEVDVVVGARSAVFAPTPRLGLIVLDEEHEPSFKQDTVPRYHAKEVARQRARMEGVPLVLGSATPSLESWHAVETGRIHIARLPKRVSNLNLPDVHIVDLRDARRASAGISSISRPLAQAMRVTLDDHGQVILFMNRRGFSTNIQCPACGYALRCPDCDLALTLHVNRNDMEGLTGGRAARHRIADAICHQCNFQLPAPVRCSKCSFEGIRFAGYGTQRVEQEVQLLFPAAQVLRVDSDTMQGPESHEQALERFRVGEAQILLGTQMIAKGLDFPNVMLVGVLNADLGLHRPDFRASERTFQLVTQVAGRSGRSARGGQVIVQTYTPDHFAIQCAAQHDVERFIGAELVHRQRYQYPPYGELIRGIFRGDIASRVEKFAREFAQSIQLQSQGISNVQVLGPAPCPYPKVRGQFRFHLLARSTECGIL